MNEKTYSLAIALLLAGGTCVSALDAGPGGDTRWHSLFGSTHKKIAKEALKRINKDAYPDLDRASSILKDGSASESGHADMMKDNGGRPKEIWETGNRKNPGGVLGNYKALKPGDAYQALGVICHLTQDMAVPAHAANIEHFLSEGLEEYAAFFGEIGQVPEIDSSKAPYEYYQLLQDDTRSRLASWLNPETGVPFWVPSPEASRSGEDVTFGARGSYGGGKDTYIFWKDKPGGNSGHGSNTGRTMVSRMPEISRERVGTSAGYTRAVMESASRLLPPLVKDLSVYPNVITPGGKVKLSFIALDNRSRALRYSVRLIGAKGNVSVLTEGTAALDKPSGSLYPSQNSDGGTQDVPAENFLFSRGLSTTWEPRQLAEGTYTVEVQLTDEDGNTVPAEVNTDGIRENDSRTFLSVVNTIPEPPASSFSFDGGGG